MKHLIDPTVDCVFKAILGSIENKNLLVDFLNAVLNLSDEREIADITILNPYNSKDYETDKLTIVDLKAKDTQNTTYQIEIQVSQFGSLNHRMLYTWSHIYKDQIKQGDGYQKLLPVISIWLLTKNMIPKEESSSYHHHFKMVDENNHQVLSDHCNIHLLELPKWNAAQITTPEQFWMYFFKEGRNIDVDNPPGMLKQSKIMRQAMSTLKQFSEKDQAYYQYQARLDFIRQQSAIEYDLSQAHQKAEQAEQKAKQAIEDKQKEAQKANQAIQEAKQAKQKAEQSAQNEQKAIQEAKQAEQKAEQSAQNEQKATQKADHAIEDKQKLLDLLKKHNIDLDSL